MMIEVVCIYIWFWLGCQSDLVKTWTRFWRTGFGLRSQCGELMWKQHLNDYKLDGYLLNSLKAFSIYVDLLLHSMWYSRNEMTLQTSRNEFFSNWAIAIFPEAISFCCCFLRKSGFCRMISILLLIVVLNSKQFWYFYFCIFCALNFATIIFSILIDC